MRRRLAGLAVIGLACSLATEGQAGPGACFWVHGRLSAFNGAPTFRIWRLGTRRILGVHKDPQTDAAIDDLPGPVRALVGSDAFQVVLFGDFQVCPLAKDRPGRMRPVLLRQAKNLSATPADLPQETPGRAQ